MQNILDTALRPSTRRAYQRHWDTFDRLCYSHLGIDAKLPADVNHILLFLAYLHTANRKHSTLQSYVSALSYRHKLADVVDTPSKALIKKFLLGTKNVSPNTTRLHPITFPILQDTLHALSFLQMSHYNLIMLTAMMSLLYWRASG